MPVPKTAMHEYGLLATGKDQVRTAGKRLSMQAVSIAFGMDKSTDDHFRLGVFASYSRHDPTSVFGGQAVHDHIH